MAFTEVVAQGMNVFKRVHLQRIREVLAAFYDLGFEEWIKQMRVHYLLPARKRWFAFLKKQPPATEEIKKDFPIRLRLALERLGATYIKLGQMLSLRADIVGEEIADELRKLQDNVSPVPFVGIKEVIEKELGKPLNKIFKEFDERTVGSASVAQVYKAVLSNGKTVAVKVLRPEIESTVWEDVLLLKWAAETIEERVPSARPFHPAKFMDEFADWTIKELNLQNEATNIEHFRELFKNEERIYIPAVHWKYTAKRILTTDFSPGMRIDDFSAYKKLGCQREEIAATGMRLAFKQFFEFGFFHGDPHPGNMFIQKNNTICLHDFGIVGRIGEEMRRELIACYVDFFERDAEGAARHLLHIAKLDENSDTEGFKRKVVEILETWLYSPTAGTRLSVAFYKMIISGAAHKISFPQNVVLLAKAVVTMESLALKLDPKFDIIENLRPYLDGLLKMELNPERVLKRGRETMLDATNIAADIPEAAKKIIDIIGRETVGVKLNTKDFLEIKKEIDRQSDVRILGMILAADLLATAVLLQLEGVRELLGVSLGALGVLGAAFLSIAVLFKIRKGY